MACVDITCTVSSIPELKVKSAYYIFLKFLTELDFDLIITSSVMFSGTLTAAQRK